MTNIITATVYGQSVQLATVTVGGIVRINALSLDGTRIADGEFGSDGYLHPDAIIDPMTAIEPLALDGQELEPIARTDQNGNVRFGWLRADGMVAVHGLSALSPHRRWSNPRAGLTVTPLAQWITEHHN